MERINRILNHDLFKRYYLQIEEAEKERLFCRHDMGHFLDVARLAWIINLEKNLDLNQEHIYATALLHDIGRFLQYLDGTPHHEASATLAPEILEACDFNKQEIIEITEAIREHRNVSIADENTLRGVIYRADKMSRACFCCKKEIECNWDAKKKNLILVR